MFRLAAANPSSKKKKVTLVMIVTMLAENF